MKKSLLKLALACSALPAPGSLAQDAGPEARFAAVSADEVHACTLDAARRVADLALIPSQVHTSPLPGYDYDKLDYGMTIGIERTPGGRLWACWVAGGDSPKAYILLASSSDDDASWSRPRMVVDAHSPALPMDRSVLVGNLWSDPAGKLWLFDGFQAPDGAVYISYDRNRATEGEILLARFTEEDVLAGRLVGPKSALKRLICGPMAPKQSAAPH